MAWKDKCSEKIWCASERVPGPAKYGQCKWKRGSWMKNSILSNDVAIPVQRQEAGEASVQQYMG